MTDPMLKKLLGDELTQQIIKEMGIERDSPETQGALLSMLGDRIMQRIVVKIIKKLPASERVKFESLIGEGDILALRTLLHPYIPDVDLFIATEARHEFDTLKQKVDTSLG